MWYLIVPPFVIVIALGTLLWFLSRRMGDADIAEKLSSMSGSSGATSHSRALSRRAFLLKMLERIASRFKTATLRVHNFFQSSLEQLRRRRTELDAMRKSLGEQPVKRERSSVFSRKAAGNESGSVETSSKAFLEEAFPEEEGARGNGKVVATDGIAESRPMLRERVVRPESAPVSRAYGSREESLIARIVENPRDAAAYEELGDCYFASSNLQDAKECYRQALKLHPTNRAVKVKIRRLEKAFEDRSR
ncbi:MAG: tetratricopeptide repeat protein [Candidatus Moranbacteria bacterium]|nr:tetratricopeptide repeat protein [Candidatus Moranbacteria bacterium]